MTDPNNQPARTTNTGGIFDPGANNVQLIYILYLASFVLGITGLVGLILAYINRGKSEAWIDTHYIWAIRTFWIGVLYSFISILLMIIGIGFLLMFVVAIWLIVRMVIGLQAVGRNEPIKKPTSWLI